jgi:hypothetical protein
MDKVMAFVIAVICSALIAMMVYLLVLNPDEVHIHTLPDGTKCATYRSMITCDWSRIPQPQPKPQPLT